MEVWQFYLTMGLVLVALEIVVPGFVLAPLGIASMLTAGAAWLGAGPLLQAAAFALAAAALFLSLKQWNKSRFAASPENGVFGIVGQVGVVIEAEGSANRPGRVKVFSDEFEILPDEAPAEPFVLGERVRIFRVLGNKVSVKRHAPDTNPSET